MFAVLAIGLPSVVAQTLSDLVSPKPKNIILMIGDGMGLAQVSAASTVNKDPLNMEKCSIVGLIKTHSADAYVTDSAAAGTALACGVRTNNRMLGIGPDSAPVKSIFAYARDEGKSTGLVVTSTVVHATPAAFVVQNSNRNSYEAIAEAMVKSPPDVFIGGGSKYFNQRKDGVDLTEKLKAADYTVAMTLDEVEQAKTARLAGLLAGDHMPAERGDMLSRSVSVALRLLGQNPKGFFLMVEGSQIDFAGHRNEFDRNVAEMLDFDKAVGVALEFARKSGDTLVVITADHETGGLSLIGGDLAKGEVTPFWAGKSHTAIMVPVFAEGVGAQAFSGVYDNTGIFDRMLGYVVANGPIK